MTNSLVSICIPAWERPELALAAARSALSQTYRDVEVVVADDSRTDAVGAAFETLRDSRVRYYRNAGRLGQSGNVNRLFELARGERIVLLHDDNLLVPDALEVLDQAWRTHPGLLACYGKQRVISHSGLALPQATDDFNRSYQRNSAHAGIQPSKLWAALVEQMPPDGALISTSVARALRFRAAAEVGDDCDYDFIVRLAQQPGEFLFVDRYISEYRLTDRGVASEKRLDFTFGIARDLDVPPELEPERLRILRARAAYAVRCHIACGERRRAWEIVREPLYWSAPRSRQRIKSLIVAILPSLLVRGMDATRRATGRSLRRSERLYRWIGRLRSVR